MSAFSDSSENCAPREPADLQPVVQSDTRSPQYRFAIFWLIDARLIGLGIGEGVNEVRRTNAFQELDLRTCYLRASASTAGPGKKQQGTVTLSAQRFVTGFQNCLHRVFCQSVFFLRKGTTLGVCLAGARQQLTHLGVMARIFQLPQLMRLGQHRNTVDQSVVGHSSKFALVAAIDKNLIDLGWQL